METCIRVDAPGGGYDIQIEPDALFHIARFEPKLLLKRMVIVTNTTLAELYGDRLIETFPNAGLAVVPDGEQYKTLDTVAGLYGDFVAAGLDRGGAVMAFGGGVVGDMAGLAAATYMRGVGFVQIPSSLLAMVDSSVGGKVGVDLPQGKNLVGAFKQPDTVVIDPNLLQTLPEREWRCGMAEVIKHGFIADEWLLDSWWHTPEFRVELIYRAVQVKVKIVQQDPYEQNIRAYLNLGHTFAHAIEQVSGYQWLHGEAVGVGLLAAAQLSLALGLCDAALVDKVGETLSSIGLPNAIGDLDPDAIWGAMATDKKWKNGRSRFVLLRAIGEPTIVEDVPKDKVISVLKGLK